MSPDTDLGARTVAEPAWVECEAIIKRFEDAWAGPTRPDLATFAPPDHPLRTRLLAELAHVDLEFRLRHGEDARVEEYLARFPELAGAGVAVELIAAEFALRRRAGAVSRDALLDRFPQYREALAPLLSSAPGVTAGSSVRPWATAPPVPRPVIPGYDIEAEVGRGGMGVVYRSRQPGLGRVVAVKTLRFPEGAARDRFRREAEAMARLDHPHIAPVYEVGEWHTAGGLAVPYFTMKWYPGGSLDARPCGPGTDPAAHARLVETVARALHHAHQRGVLHRDLKPSNVLLDEAGEAHVADFGLAGLFDPLAAPLGGRTGTALGTSVDVHPSLLGTPAYMAPEQARNPSRVTTAADVYGLGAVLYHLLAGRAPFRADDPVTLLELAATTPPDPLAKVNPAVPRDLEAVCLKCLSKDPGARYASAEEVGDDLARFRQGLPVSARPLPAWVRVWRWTRRHAVVAGMGVATFTALVASVVVLWVSNARVREREAAAVGAARSEYALRCELELALARDQRLIYAERVRAAGWLHAAGRFSQARRLLDECEPRLRGWEWRYLNSLGEAPPTPRVAKPADATEVDRLAASGAVALGPDGGVRVTADADGVVRVRSVANGTVVRELTAPGGLACVAFGQGGTRLAAGGPGGVVYVWDADTGRDVLTLTAGSPVRAVAWAGDDLLALTDSLLTWHPLAK